MIFLTLHGKIIVPPPRKFNACPWISLSHRDCRERGRQKNNSFRAAELNQYGSRLFTTGPPPRHAKQNSTQYRVLRDQSTSNGLGGGVEGGSWVKQPLMRHFLSCPQGSWDNSPPFKIWISYLCKWFDYCMINKHLDKLHLAVMLLLWKMPCGKAPQSPSGTHKTQLHHHATSRQKTI